MSKIKLAYSQEYIQRLLSLDRQELRSFMQQVQDFIDYLSYRAYEYPEEVILQLKLENLLHTLKMHILDIE